jgi:DNA topoisomerase-1
MPKRLLVVESPGKVKKLSQIRRRRLDREARVVVIFANERDEGEDSLGFTMDDNTVKFRYVARDHQVSCPSVE